MFGIIVFAYFLSLLSIIGIIIYFFAAQKLTNPLSKYVVIFTPVGIILSLVLYKSSDIWKYIKYLPSYFYYISAYINLFQIYAICKTDDITWGTRKKPDSKYIGKKNAKSKKFLNFKFKKLFYLVLYVFSNSAFAVIFQWYFIFRLSVNGFDSILQIIYVAGLLLLIIPFVGQLFYVFSCLLKLCSRKKQIDPTIFEVEAK